MDKCGNKVLDISTHNEENSTTKKKLHVYAHCTKLVDEDSENSKSLLTEKYTTPGALTVLYINFEKEQLTNINFPFLLEFPQEERNEDILNVAERHEYILTPYNGDLTSSTSLLNEETQLKVKMLKSNPPKFVYPQMSPKIVDDPTNMIVTVPPLSYGFIVYPNAGVEACM